MPRKTLYLIDGHAQIYRAYYAPFRPLTSPTGEPTKATYGFFQMLLNILRDRKPDYLAMVMDVSDKSVFRTQIDPQYKAHRDPSPEDLGPQIERIVTTLQALNLPILRLSGWEADDIFATLCQRFRGDEIDIYLVSKDKDLEQLLCDNVWMYDPGKNSVIDAVAMEANKGYPPSKAVEAQMLIGDSVDNIKGVIGVGPKKAAELLAKYGDVAGIIANAAQLTPKLREAVEAFASRADIVRQLVTLRPDVPIEFALEHAEITRLKGEGAGKIFRELGFNRLTEQLDTLLGKEADAPRSEAFGKSEQSAVRNPQSAIERARSSTAERVGSSSTPADRAQLPPMEGGLFDQIETPADAEQPNESHARFTRGDYRLIDDEAQLTELAARMRDLPEFAFDTETTGLSAVDADLVGISIAWEAGNAFYIPTRGIGKTIPIEAIRRELGPIFADPKIAKSGQNLKFDVNSLRPAGIEVAGVRFDTMLASFVHDSTRRSHGIDALALDLLGIRKIATSELIGKGKDQLRFDQLDTARVAIYACEDADVAWRLKEYFEPRIKEAGFDNLFYDLEMPLVEVLALMEYRGVALDTDLLARLSNEMAQRLLTLTHDIHAAAGRPFNIDSTKQLAEVLFDELKLPVVKRTKTGRSTDAEVLAELAEKTAHAVPKLLLEYRELSKLKGTYIDALPEMVSPRTQRVHCSFHLTGAVTGRLSSSDPNLQNIPIRTEAGAQIRRAFVPGANKGVGDRVWGIGEENAVASEPYTLSPTPYTLVSADYSQIELRVLAHFSGDEALRQAFAEDRDIHQFVASQVFSVPLDEVTKEQRGRAKTVNFGIVYGQTAFGLSRQTGMSQGDARVFIEAYFQRYPRIREFLKQCIDQARSRGFVETMLGRRRAIQDLDSRNPQARAAAERFAVNTVVQGTAADIIKRAMTNIHRRIIAEKRPSRMLIQVHDELVFETPQDALADEARMIRDEMSGAIPLSVPVKVDIAAGPNWLDVQDLDLENP